MTASVMMTLMIAALTEILIPALLLLVKLMRVTMVIHNMKKMRALIGRP